MPSPPTTQTGPNPPTAHGDGSVSHPALPPAAPPTPRQRDPPVFSGASTQDIEDWLSSYERVGAYNRWDDATKLTNVVFYLQDLAKTWFENHETEFTTWSSFRDRLRELFGKPAARKANAARKLSARYQRPGESYAAYIEDVLALCNKTDSAMSEQDKITNITKGIAEEAFQYLLLKDPVTVSDVIHACRTLQEKRNTRLIQASVTASEFFPAQQPDIDTLRSLIRELIREELGNAIPRPPCIPSDVPPLSSDPPSHTTIQALVHEEVAAALRSEPSSHPRPTYADVLRTSPPVPSYSTLPVPPPTAPMQTLAPLYPSPANSYYPINRRRETRTCFYCGIQGHVARFCRRRRQDFSTSGRYFDYGPPDTSSSRPVQRDDPDSLGYRGGAPYNRRSSPIPPTRRRSLSPYRGRSPVRDPPRRRSPSPQGNQ